MSSREHSNESCPRPHSSKTPQRALHLAKSPVSSQTSPSPKSSKEKLNESYPRLHLSQTPQKALQILKSALYLLKRAPCLQESIPMSRAPTDMRMSHAPTNIRVSRHTKALHLLLHRALYHLLQSPASSPHETPVSSTAKPYIILCKALYLLQKPCIFATQKPCIIFCQDEGLLHKTQGVIFSLYLFNRALYLLSYESCPRPQPSEVK